MSAFPLTRRAALAGLGAFALSVLTRTPAALAQPGLRIRAIKVDVSPIRASMGDPTAAWVEESLPGALAHALGPYMAPGDRNGATLVARIDYLYLGSSSGGPGFFRQTQDTIVGSLSSRIKMTSLGAHDASIANCGASCCGKGAGTAPGISPIDNEDCLLPCFLFCLAMSIAYQRMLSWPALQ